MPVILELPAEIEQRLRADDPASDRGMHASMALELFRKEKITLFELRTTLGMSKVEINRYLNQIGEYSQTPTHEELDEDLRTVQEVMRKHGR